MYRNGSDLHKETCHMMVCGVGGGAGIGGGSGRSWPDDINKKTEELHRKKNSKSTQIKKSIKELDLLDHYWLLIWLSLVISNTGLFLNDLF